MLDGQLSSSSATKTPAAAATATAAAATHHENPAYPGTPPCPRLAGRPAAAGRGPGPSRLRRS
jgi:hypothetical protein